ncbi:MAG: hypothetical protein IJ562_07415, partial [Prevotella sp.]|nr:hypothetical protein [Prevotella sp.]
FCNFVVGNHEYILLSYFISNRKSPIKVQKISQITNFLENFLIPNWRREYMRKNGQKIPIDAWINKKPKIFNVFFNKKHEDKVKRILNEYSKNYRECIRDDERGVEFITEDRKGSRGFLDVLIERIKGTDAKRRCQKETTTDFTG